MTITTNPARNEYTSTAGQTVFNYTFKIYTNADLNVYVTPVGQVANDATDITTAYTVDTNTIGDEAGGFITFDSPLNVGELVTIVSAIPDDRNTDYQFNGDFIPDTVNNDFDRNVSLVKQLENSLNRTVQFQESQQGTSALTLPAPSPGELIIWNPAGDGFDNSDGTDVGGINQAVIDAQAAQAGAELAETNAQASETNAATSASNASTSETNAAASEAAAQLLYDNFNDIYYGALASDPATAPSGDPSTAGDLYFNTTNDVMREYTGSAWKDVTATDAVSVNYDNATSGLAATDVQGAVDEIATGGGSAVTSSASRNTVLDQEPVTQGTATRVGFSATTYTGNGTSQSISTGVDMATGDFGGLVWGKSRGTAVGHWFFDTVRGAGEQLSSDSTGAESTQATMLTSFDADGFTMSSDTAGNQNTIDYASWNWQTTAKTSGVTNQNKPYTSHYNPDLGFSIVGYEGSGVANHEIPHHLGREPELQIQKNRDNGTTNWHVTGTIIEGSHLALDLTVGLTTSDSTTTVSNSTTTTTMPTGWAGVNGTNGNNYILYNFVSTPQVMKIGKYIGTGAAGNYVSTSIDGDAGFKPAFVLIKNLTTAATNWITYDSARGEDNVLYPNLSNAESATDTFDFVVDGFAAKLNDSNSNTLNNEYLFLAIADTNATTGRADVPYATTADTLTIQGLISYAEGFTASGEVNSQEQVNTTFTLGAGFEDKQYYLYKDKDGAYGVSEYRPLEQQDYSGVPSPLSPDTTRTTAKHFDYESSTGVASASGERGTSWLAYQAFDQKPSSASANAWEVTTTTASWLQYKHVEPRVLKSWRFQESATSARRPRRFTIEGSNDPSAGWTAIDSTYTASDYTGNGADLWGDIQDTSGNTTAYLYHRINITANNGDGTYTAIGELEFNTITPSDRYDVTQGKIYNNAGTEIDRVYLASLRTDSNGDVIKETIENYTPNKLKTLEAEIHQDLTVRGEINNKQVATAWVNFDSTQNPPLIRDSFNVADVVDRGTGIYTIIFETPMEDISYTLSGSINNIGFVRNNAATRNSVNVLFYSTSAALLDSDNNTIQIFGGKD